MKILFIGGNGNISWHCTQLAIENGHEIWQLNREQSVLTRRKIQPQVRKLKGNMREIETIKKLLDSCSFDVVCDFICYNEEHAKNDIEIFRDNTKRFIFVSSESVYQRDPILDADFYTENSEKYDASCGCDYIVGKLMAERVFMDAYQREGFPITIVRPFYTYDTIFPTSIGHNCFTAAELILKGYPLLIAGNGKNLWSFMNSSDFAEAFIGLAENEGTVGESFNIGMDEGLSWNDQSELVLRALGAKASGIFHIPSDEALTLEEIQPRTMMFHRIRNNVSCTEKVKRFVPGWTPKISFEEGIQKTVCWLNEDIRHKRHVDKIYNSLMAVYERYGIRL